MMPLEWPSRWPAPIAPWVQFAQFRYDRLAFLSRLMEQSDFVHLVVGNVNAYVVSSNDHVKEILINQNKKLHKGLGVERTRSVLGQGLLTAEDGLHHRQRRLVQPAFHRQRLQGYGTSMIDLTRRYAEKLVDGEYRDMHTEMMRLTLEIVGKTLFDADTSGSAAVIGEALHSFISNFNFILLPIYPLVEKYNLPLPAHLAMQRARKVLDAYIFGLIDDRRRTGRDHGDLLSMLLAAVDDEEDGSGMSNEQLRDEIITLLLAGHETTANALTWTLYLLSQHPAIESRLLAELDTVLGSRPPTIEDYPKLAYTEQVFAESMRLYPPVYAFSRRVMEPVQIDDHTIPPGAVVFVPIWAIHRKATYYPDPLRFDPDRFTPAARAARPRYSYLPFSHGPRNCIGEHFAWMEGVLVLATLYQRFLFRLAPGQRVEPQPLLTLRSKYGMNMRICARRPTA
jgi:cytochrome P450